MDLKKYMGRFGARKEDREVRKLCYNLKNK